MGNGFDHAFRSAVDSVRTWVRSARGVGSCAKTWDRRRFPRYPTNIPVRYRREGSRQKLLEGRILNISEGGICLYGVTVEPVGTVLEIEYMMKNSSLALIFRGEIVWFQWMEKTHGTEGVLLGVRFTEMGDRLRGFLESVMK